MRIVRHEFGSETMTKSAECIVRRANWLKSDALS
jgi:hypothetical protein